MFTTSDFLIDGLSWPFRLDRNRKGGILKHVRSKIPSKLLTKHDFSNDIKGLFGKKKNYKKQMVTFWNISPTFKKQSILF